MRVEMDPTWTESWEDKAVYGVYVWGNGLLRRWYRLTDCDVVEVLSWAEREAGADAYSVALLVSDPTERAGEQDGRVWLLGGNPTAPPPRGF